ncbi:PP2C family protein-serine/threonine phosphatase [Actinocorallia sp. A-T 12471]|uniref:PP2C family protein-serine/threonine phosphatase n=1 Tax=Actinocorallia sp. A-T 12471 TaxID=3089813 RepID=UPI0029D2FC9C|nr:protein phosphatase 2C domain-containing protein [Actinocorallia sp. A-T 12471]MDX6743302.1 protein phosphatase 2C domain-containing protein [Actinocorallia sp. A-T 12471]
MPGDVFCEVCGHRLRGREAEAGGTSRRAPADHMEIDLGHDAAAVSDRGLRHPTNQDGMALARTSAGVVAVLADGVSASPRPEEASRAAVETGLAVLTAELEAGADPRDATRTAALAAAKAVASLTSDKTSAPACTYISAVAGRTGGRDTLTLGWIGDSRAYWVGATGDELLTEDDSWAEWVIAHGKMSEEEAYADRRAHMLVGWMGADAREIDVHVRVYAPEVPGVLVVCTDGLWNYMASPIAMAAAVADPLADPVSGPLTGPRGQRRTPLSVARELVRTALHGGGHDNITVAVVPVEADGLDL